MGFEKKFNNYTISNFEEKSSKKIKAFFIDINKREIKNIEVDNNAEAFIRNNNFFKHRIVEINSLSPTVKKQIAIFSEDEDFLKQKTPFEINGFKIYSNCLICSCIRYELDIRNVEMTENEINQIVKF